MESAALSNVELRVQDYLTANDGVAYNRFTDFDWETLPESLARSSVTELQVSAVETAMIVEDHIPGYASEYLRFFAMEPGRTDAEAWQCRQMLHFAFRWVAEEDRHAQILELWLRHSGRRDPEQLTRLMVYEGSKIYQAPSAIPSQLFAYTTLQEKATQLYYSCLRQAVDEPVLRSALGKLSQDEARHTVFFSRLVIDALDHGNAKTVALLREALDQFKMPLADMMDNYRRKAIQMMRAANGYDYREAFEYFARLLRQVADRRTHARGTNLMDLLRFAEQLVPAPAGG
jgi:acyl-[acyl-carrier protein] desaturase